VHADVVEKIGLVNTALVRKGKLIQTSPKANDNAESWKQLTIKLKLRGKSCASTSMARHCFGHAAPLRCHTPRIAKHLQLDDIE
jgi:hypothetical protein